MAMFESGVSGFEGNTYADSLNCLARFRISMQRLDSGMLWGSFIFMRSAGMLHTVFWMLISSQGALRTSEVREQVRIKNSSPNFTDSEELVLRRSSMNFG